MPGAFQVRCQDRLFCLPLYDTVIPIALVHVHCGIVYITAVPKPLMLQWHLGQTLKHCRIAEHSRALRAPRHLPAERDRWLYMDTNSIYRNRTAVLVHCP